MGRFLTASKVTLLALAVVYTEGAVPLSSSTVILSFIIKNVLPLASQTSSEVEAPSSNPSVTDFETVLAKHASSIPGRTIWDLLLKKLWAIDCSDALDAFITNLSNLLAKPREQLLRERDTGEISDVTSGSILRTSPLGAFIRRCDLEYMRLQFENSVALWQDFIAYRASTRPIYEKKNPDNGKNALDANLSAFNIDSSHPLAQIMFGHLADSNEHVQSDYSTGDVEKLLEFQVSEMQRNGGRLPEDMRSQLKRMSASGTTLPKLAHYLKFLDSWRAGDYSSAFDNLHRYFDYTMQNKDRTFYQYALLNLAILQADFGCHDEAIPAMHEAIATARENRDTTCLNYCMSWLYHFGRSFPSQMKSIHENGILGSEVEGLAFLKSRAKDAEMWSLLSTTLLSEAKLGLQHGESIAVVFENIVKASHIATVKLIPNNTGPTLLMKGAVFARIGQSHMAWSSNEIFLECHAQHAPLEDVLKCTCRMASLLAQRGRSADAEAMMASISPDILRILKYNNYWIFHSSLLNLKRFLHHDDLSTAERLAQLLKGQTPPDSEQSFTLSCCEVDLYIRKGDLSHALDLVEELADKSAVETHDVNIQVRLLTLKAGLLARAGKPLKGFSIVMRAASLAYNARLLPALWDAIDHLAVILLELQEFTAVKQLLEGILPQVLECQDCELAARTHSLVADTYMGLAGLEEEKSNRRKEYVGTAMEHIEAAFEQWKFIEDLRGQLEMLSKKARIQYWRGDMVLADDTASRYLEIKKEYTDARA